MQTRPYYMHSPTHRSRRKTGRARTIPFVNLTRYNSVFARNSQHRDLVTSGKRGKDNKRHQAIEADDRTPAVCRPGGEYARFLADSHAVFLAKADRVEGPARKIVSTGGGTVLNPDPTVSSVTFLHGGFTGLWLCTLGEELP